MKKADLIIDLQYGSTGKGLIAGYLGATRDYDLVINANMPNAGHTFIDAKGNKMVHKVLPNGLVSKGIKYVGLGPGSVFDVKQLEKEMADTVRFGYSHYHLRIHENAVVLNNGHKAAEEEGHLNSIGSTKQGSSAAMMHKISRDSVSNPCAREALKGNGLMACVVTNAEWLKMIQRADNILLEGAQGYSLGINAGFYPYCTSRDCTPARFMADMGIPLPYLRRVIGTLRLHPIRVGSPEGGFSGPSYPDQNELEWSDLGVEAETTTVTGRIRRVFSWSQQQIEEAIAACMPDEIFMNFCNYDPEEVDRIRGQIIYAGMISNKIPHIKYEGWGPTVNDVKEGLINPCSATKKEFEEHF